MSNIIHFKHGGLTAAKYAGAIKRLSSAGEGFPKGRSYHVWHGDPSNFEITDGWYSMEEFKAFDKTLMPILKSLGLELGKPVLSAVHNIIKG
jgi:hypothetical protein